MFSKIQILDAANMLCALVGGMFCMLSMSAAAAGGRACDRVLISGDPDYPPFSWYDGQAMHGAAIEIVEKALERAGISYETRSVGPFNRVLLAAGNGSIDLVAEMKNLPERRAYIDFSRVPLFRNPVAVFVRADKTVKFKEWADLAGLHGGMTLGNKFGGGFDDFLGRSLTVEAANNIGANFTKLELGRIDYFVNSYYPALTYLAGEQKGGQFKALRPFVTETSNFAGWSKASPCAGKLGAFDKALGMMVKSGEVQRILDTNLAHLQDIVVAP